MELRDLVDALDLPAMPGGGDGWPRSDEISSLFGADRSVPEGCAEIRLPEPGEEISLSRLVSAVEEQVIRHVLEQEEGNISRTARRLGMSRQGLKNKLRIHEREGE